MRAVDLCLCVRLCWTYLLHVWITVCKHPCVSGSRICRDDRVTEEGGVG